MARQRPMKNGSPMRDFTSSLPDLNGRGILITGGTGSFGRRFVKTVLARYRPARLVVFSRDEMKQYEMENEFPVAQHPSIRYFLGDVRNKERLAMAMRDIDLVIHAAALKHVPAAEYNPIECIHTNILGAENVIQASIGAGVRQVMALSTDKAANPINLYGASKLAADKLFVAANALAGKGGTRFAIVRYGNVVGSRGSVVPLFRRLIAEGALELPITDPRMTRFWITLQQGVDFVLSSLEMMTGGEIFVPRIPSMRIADLAECMAPGVPHKVVGIRPGEKLHEVMVPEDDGRTTIALDDRYIIEPQFPWWSHAPHTANGARPVANGFRYSSDHNDEWLDAKGMRALLASEG
jgi:UDP-N-acetylglucosamine 4,6-dehydratase/5-epimerase